MRTGTLRNAWAVMAVLSGIAWGQAPSYTPASIVNSSDGSPGPFAPNSVLTIYGTNLSYASAPVNANVAATVPFVLGDVRVYANNIGAPLLYVSSTQINFIVPAEIAPGPVNIAVVRQGVVGPMATVTLVAGAPALFVPTAGYALAQDASSNYVLVTADAPAHSGEIVVLYATGLGWTAPNAITGAVPGTAAIIQNMATFKLYLGGNAVDPTLIKYVGVTPQSAGLYQINVALPGNLGADPEIRVAIGDQLSVAGIKLAVR